MKKWLCKIRVCQDVTHDEECLMECVVMIISPITSLIFTFLYFFFSLYGSYLLIDSVLTKLLLKSYKKRRRLNFEGNIKGKVEMNVVS